VIEATQFEAEVRELHAFFERWYCGAADPREIIRLDVLADSFVMIGPDGREFDVQMVRASVEAAYGSRSTKFNIRNVAVRPNAPIGTYEEWQTAEGITTARISTAVMMPAVDTPNGLRWLHLHETWLPDARP
jgi:hypothetical protein